MTHIIDAFKQIILDTGRMEARLHDDKLNKIINISDMFESKHIMSNWEMLSILFHLNFASEVIPHGRSFVAYLLFVAGSAKQLHNHVRLYK